MFSDGNRPGPADTLILDFQPEVWDNTFLPFQVTQFVGVCYDSPREVKYFVYYSYIEILDNDILLDSSSKPCAQGRHVGSLVSAMAVVFT